MASLRSALPAATSSLSRASPPTVAGAHLSVVVLSIKAAAAAARLPSDCYAALEETSIRPSESRLVSSSTLFAAGSILLLPIDRVFSLQHEIMLVRRACTPAKTPGPCLEAWRFARAPPPLRTTLPPVLEKPTPGTRPPGSFRRLPSSPYSPAGSLSRLDYSRTISCITFPPLRLLRPPLRTLGLQNVHVQIPKMYTRQGKASRGRSCSQCFLFGLAVVTPYLCTFCT